MPQETNPTSTGEAIFQERLAKAAALESAGTPAYAAGAFPVASPADIAAASTREMPDIQNNPASVADQLSIAGRLVSFRSHGRLSFGRLRNGHSENQIALLRGHTALPAGAAAPDIGDILRAKGELFITKTGERTLLCSEIGLLSKNLRPLPEKWHGLADPALRARRRDLDLLANPQSLQRLRLRARFIAEIRAFLAQNSFLEVETSTLTPGATGAMAKPFTTHANAMDTDFALRIALETPLKMLVGGGLADRVFEVGKCFRNEGTDPSHLPEFTMLEFYAAYQSLHWNQDFTLNLLRTAAQKAGASLQFACGDQTIDLAADVPAVTFSELLERDADLRIDAADNEVQNAAHRLGVDDINAKTKADLLDDIFKKTSRPQLVQPVFVTDYPAALKPLCRASGGVAECFQLVIGGWEVVNAYAELTDPRAQRAALQAQGPAALAAAADFLAAMETGFPPMTGTGIGLDRFAALLTGAENLRDVVNFPVVRG